MPRNADTIVGAAEAVLAEQNTELQARRARQMLAVGARAATGGGDIDAAFSLDVRFRLVFLRCHFSGTAGTAALVISLDSSRGGAYDTKLFTIARAGVGRDVNFRITADESRDPSPWTFQAGDTVRVQWTNPDSGNITWGLEVGLAMAS